MDTTNTKELLTQEEERLLKEMQNIGRENPANSGKWELLPPEQEFEPDPVDRAEIVANSEDTAAVLANLEARHVRVVAALARVEDGTYGTCAVCSKPIEPERLTADPAATTCTEHM